MLACMRPSRRQFKCRLPPIPMHPVRGLQRAALVCPSAIGFCVSSALTWRQSSLYSVLLRPPKPAICRAVLIIQQTSPMVSLHLVHDPITAQNIRQTGYPEIIIAESWQELASPRLIGAFTRSAWS